MEYTIYDILFSVIISAFIMTWIGYQWAKSKANPIKDNNLINDVERMEYIYRGAPSGFVRSMPDTSFDDLKKHMQDTRRRILFTHSNTEWHPIGKHQPDTSVHIMD